MSSATGTIAGRTGTPYQITPTDIERFRAKASLNPATGCLLWDGWLQGNGYGRFSVNGKNRFAHRIAWEIAHGPVPVGMFVCHRCDTPCCVEHTHLFLSSARGNMADMTEKGRAANGAINGRVKLTQDKVDEIRRRSADGATRQELATAFGVSISNIGQVCTGQIWRKRDIALDDLRDRLAKAEAALREIARAECRLTTIGYKVTCVQAVAQYPGECLECASCIARRYFAEKGDDRG